MKLSIHERLTLLGLLPNEGNFILLVRVDEAKKALTLTEDETIEVNFRQEGENLMWDDIKKEYEIDLGETITDLFAEKLKRLDKESKLKPEQVSLYRKFVEGTKVK